MVKLFKTRKEIIEEALENAEAERLILVYISKTGELECLASDEVTILEAVGMLESAKAGFVFSSYENTQ